MKIITLIIIAGLLRTVSKLAVKELMKEHV